jgi:hypothetical protein
LRVPVTEPGGRLKARIDDGHAARLYPSRPLRQISPRSPPARIDAQYTPDSARNEGNQQPEILSESPPT